MNDLEALRRQLLQEDNAKLNERMEDMKKELDHLMQEKAVWSMERQELIQAQRTSENQAKQWRSDFERLVRRMKSSDLSLVAKQKELLRQEKALEALTAKVNEKFASMHEFKRQRVELDDDKREFSEVLQYFRQEMAEIREYDDTERRVLLERIAELENRPEPATVVVDDDEVEALRKKLNAVENENRNGRKYVSKLQEDIKRLEEENLQLKHTASDTLGEFSTMDSQDAQRQIDDLKMDICQLKLEKNNLKHEVAAKVSELEAVQTELEQAKADLSQFEDEIVKLKAEVVKNDAELQASNERISRLTSTMDARAAILDEVEAKLQESEAARDELVESKTFWENKAAKLERVVQQYGSEIQSLQSTAHTKDTSYSQESLAHGKQMVEQFYLSYYHSAESKHRLLLKETKEKDMALARQGADLNHVRQVLENLLDAEPAAMRVAVDGLLASLDR